MTDVVANDPWAEFRAKPGPAADQWAEFRKKSPSLSWSAVPGEAMRHVPESAGKLAQAIVHPILHPIDTVQDIADVGAGAIRAGAKKVLPETIFNAIDSVGDQETNKRIEDKATAVGRALNDRYGGLDELKHTLATDPVGAIADASVALTGGGSLAARAPGVVGRAGEAARTVGAAVDPIANVGRAVSRSGGAVADALGVSTGAGARPFREAFEAGRAGNEVFAEHMRGERPIADVVGLADNAVSQMGRDRSAAYNANMAGVRESQAVVDFTPVFNALQNAYANAHYRGVPIDVAAADVVTRMRDITQQFAAIPGQATPERFDALKRALGEVRQRTQQGTLERRLADQVFHGVRNEITRQVPDYAAAMRDYANASDTIDEMRRTMSINDRAAPDTTLRKLQSTMRNNVNTNYGARERLLDELAQHEPDLPAALAGQSLNTVAPRGLARISPMTVIASGGATMNPLSLAALPFTSPRLMGEATFAAGQGAGAVERAMHAAGVTPNAVTMGYRTPYTLSAMLRGVQPPESEN